MFTPISLLRPFAIVCALLASFTCWCHAAGSAADGIPVVDLAPKGPALVSNFQLYGHNMDITDWHGATETREPPFIIDPRTGKPDLAWNPLTHAFPLRRVRLNWGNHYPWRDSVGPLSRRKTITHEQWGLHYLKEAGLDEYLRWVESLPGSPKPSLVASPLRPVQELADLVAYCNATKGPMAKLRAANGHPKPYNVMDWELGNEVFFASRSEAGVAGLRTDAEKNERIRASDYVALIEPRIKAMRAIDPKIKLYIVARTPSRNADDPGWEAWHREVLRAVADRVDGIIHHPYYDGYPVSDMLYVIDMLAGDVRAASKKDHKLTVWVSEHARWMDDKKATRTYDLQGTISAADFLIQLMRRPEVEAASYWCYSPHGFWRVLQEDGSRRYGTGIFELYRMLNEITFSQTQLLVADHHDFKSFPRGYPYAVSAVMFADRATGRKSLLAVNRSPEQSFILRFPYGAKDALAVRRIVLTGESMESANIPETPDGIARAEWLTTRVPEPDGSVKLELPAKSVTAWVFAPVGDK